MDVVCFDKNRFIHNLYKNDVEESVIQYNLEKKKEEKDFNDMLKKAE